MARLQLRGEYIKEILAGYDQMEKMVNNPQNALKARQAKIVPAEYIMAHLAASIVWLSKRHSFFLTEQLVAEIMRDLKATGEKVTADFEQRVSKMMEGKSNDG